MLVAQARAGKRSRDYAGVVSHLGRGDHADAQFSGNRFGHRFTTVQLQQHPRLHTRVDTGFVERTAGGRTRFAQDHDLLVQLSQRQIVVSTRPEVPCRQQRT
ncbi:hypothetical protein D3C71_1945160 [compost metagenome]